MMDWENKFSSILKETEANLSRIKTRFSPGSAGPWSQRNYSTPMKKSNSLMDLPLASKPKLYQNGLGTSQHGTSREMFGLQEGVSHYNGTTTQTMPYPTAQALQEKIEQQSIAINHLTGVIHRLETDRNNYQEQIRDLRNEVFTLSEKTVDRRPDPHIERRMEQVRRELLGEIQMLQSQLQLATAKGSNSQMSDAQLLAMNRDVLEIKHAFRDELEAYRRDIEILRSRLVKVELELASVLSGRHDVERRQDKLDRTLNTMSVSQRANPSTEFTNTSRQLEKMQIEELRATLTSLRGKIDIMESSFTKTPTGSPKKAPSLFSNGYAARPSLSVSSQNAMIGDLDISDDDTESSDFTEFQPGEGTEHKKKDIDLDTVNTDDLDIDDLYLSDDDLSQASLTSDPIDDAELT